MNFFTLWSISTSCESSKFKLIEKVPCGSLERKRPPPQSSKTFVIFFSSTAALRELNLKAEIRRYFIFPSSRQAHTTKWISLMTKQPKDSSFFLSAPSTSSFIIIISFLCTFAINDFSKGLWDASGTSY